MRRLLPAFCLVLALNTDAAPHPHHDEAAPPAPGYGALAYHAPAPGSYTLPVIRAAADGSVVRDDGVPTSLHALYTGKLTVLGFIYTHCADPNGCPLATFVMRQIARRAATHAALAGKVRLVSLSFDPARDTPAQLAKYAASFRKPEMDWQFVTAPDAATLAPVLDAYGQSVQLDPDGGAYSHQLRVFVIDAERNIRNEYSTSFLHADTVVADLITIALAENHSTTPSQVSLPPTLAEAGDAKQDYERPDYRTRSRALAARQGAAADLLASLRSPPLGLPPVPADRVPSRAALELGRRLFFDRRLSHNQTLACASCHVPDQGFTHSELATPVGLEGRTVRRNAPSLYNVAHMRLLFHDGRETSLAQQVWGPLLAFNEMANPSIGFVLERLRALEDYAVAFAEVFPGRGLTQETLGEALAAYELALVSGHSAFDRWKYARDTAALTAEQARGYALFVGKAGCSGCHLVGESHALFTDHGLHNTGVGYARSMHRETSGPVPVGPGIVLTPAVDAVAASSERPPNDLGRYEITLDPADRWKFRTPGLRNVALTAPYMHDGSLRSLEEVIDFYDRGGVPNEGLDPRLQPLGLAAPERRALAAFLRALTGNNVDTLVRDAFAQRIGDRTSRGADAPEKSN
ncbi:MAG: cytochrome c peroxidase [Gammaproteobacteria bacterium]